ncbi:MAG: transcriptional repressor LexA [Burkholderiaceae bacterium]|jgi:repressor LexA|nr:transcriptional repressor LexA [Burkholderiaceae bacterium]
MDTNTVKPKLTARQEEILELIQDSIAKSGMPPTRAEIAKQLGFASANAAEEHLRALSRKGYLELSPGTSRGIKLAHQMTLPIAALQQLSLPLIGRVAAGSPILAVEHVEKQIPVDPSLFDRGADYLLKVRGMSMRDAGILEGDYLAVKKTSDVRSGDIVVARLEDEVTVKRWSQKKTNHGLMIELVAENPDFENILIDPRREEIVVEGLAVGLIRPGGL